MRFDLFLYLKQQTAEKINYSFIQEILLYFFQSKIVETPMLHFFTVLLINVSVTVDLPVLLRLQAEIMRLQAGDLKLCSITNQLRPISGPSCSIFQSGVTVSQTVQKKLIFSYLSLL